VKKLIAASALICISFARAASAQPTEPLPTAPPDPAPPPAAPPPVEPVAPPPEPAPPPHLEATPAEPPTEEPSEKPMSEGRAIASAWNTGFQWGIAPGVVFVDGKSGFFMGLRLGYGFDTGSVILVPGARLAGYFTNPNVYVGMPVMKLVYPIDRFAPFIEGGAGVGHVAAGGATAPSHTGAALLGGGGFMIHFSLKFGLGVEANYQVVTGTGFKGFGVGPILALAF
jgi:hypothetical protein